MIEFYCQNFSRMKRNEANNAIQTLRNPGYEVGSASPEIWPVAGGGKAARHFFNNTQGEYRLKHPSFPRGARHADARIGCPLM